MGRIIRYSAAIINRYFGTIVICFVIFDIYDERKCGAVFPQDRWKSVPRTAQADVQIRRHDYLFFDSYNLYSFIPE